MSFFQKHQVFFNSICSKIISKSSFSYLIILKSFTPAFLFNNKSSVVFVKRLSVLFLHTVFSSLSNISQRVTLQMTIAMTRCETRQTPHHQLKCCGDQTVQTISRMTEQGTVKRKHSTFTGLVRGTAVRV